MFWSRLTVIYVSTMLNEFYRVAFRKKVYRSIDELRADLDCWIKEYNEARPHPGRWSFGKTPMQIFLDAMPMTKEKMIAAQSHPIPKPDRSTRHQCQIEFRLIHVIYGSGSRRVQTLNS
jgi:hypothetical protein